MATTASSVTSAGTYLANGSFDEVSFSASNLNDSVNLINSSQDFSPQGYWGVGGTGSTRFPVMTYDVAPDGTYTASLFTAAGLYPNITRYYAGYGGLAVQPGETYTYSIYLKYVNQTFATITQENAWPAGYYVIFNIQNGTVIAPGFNIIGSAITSVGNGWYRCSMSYVAPATNLAASQGPIQYYYGTTPPTPTVELNPQVRIGTYDGTDYTGSKMLIWGAQLELGSSPSVYKPTSIPKNYLKFTQDFTKTNTNAAAGGWFLDNAVTTGNTIVAPDGTMTGSMVTSTITGGNNTAYVNQTVTTLVNNTNYTYSVYLKQGTSPTSVVDFYNANPYNEITATVTWGATPTMITGTGSGGVVVASSFTNAGNGWYRVSLTINTLNNSAQLVCRVYVRGQGTNNVAGETVYIWGAQLEQSSSPGPYVSNGINITKINPLNQVFNNNLLTYSQTFSDASWTKTLVSLGATTTAPDGTSTAVKLVNSSDATSQFHSIDKSFTIAVAGTYTFSVFVKASELTNVGIYQNSGTSGTTWNLSTQSLISTDTGVTASFNACPNGWYRISNTYTYASAGTYSVRVYLMNPGTNYVGNGTSGLFIWGAQLEYGAKTTPYQSNLATITPVLPYTQPATKTVADGTVYVPGNYDEVTYNPTNVNLLSYSQELDNTAWGKNAVTILPNTIIAPDGTLTADKIQETAVTTFFAVVQNPTALPSKSYTMSFYAKAGERTQVVVSFTVSNAYVMYNLATGTVTTTSGAYLVGSSITFVGNGWYRCTASLTSAPSGSNLLYFIIALANSNSDTYAGTTGYGAYVWGTQLEQNTVPTTYQVTPPASPPPNLVNKFIYTEDLTNSIYLYDGGSLLITGNSTTAPNNTLTADTLTNINPASIFANLSQRYVTSTPDYYTLSYYVKNSNATTISVLLGTNNFDTANIGGLYFRSVFDLTTKTFYSPQLATGPGVSITIDKFTYGYTDVGNDWLRIYVTADLRTASSIYNIRGGMYLGTYGSTGASNGKSIYMWGWQLEQNLSASIYQGVSAQNTLITGFAKRDTQAGITYVTDKFDEFTKILPVTSGLILNLDSSAYNSGTTWQNQTVNSYNATLINNPAYNSDNGGIIKFTGNASTPQYVTTTIPSSTFTPSSNWTMSTWVRFNASNTSIAYLNPRPDGLGFYGTSGNLLGCVYYGNYGLFWTTNVYNNVRGFYVGSQVRTGSPYSESNIQTSNLTFGVWYNVTGVYDYTGNSHKLYINGALVNTAGVVTTGTFQNFASIPFIGSGTDAVYGGSSSGKVLDGDLGQNLIYNRALTAQEVLDNYNALKGRYGY